MKKRSKRGDDERCKRKKSDREACREGAGRNRQHTEVRNTLKMGYTNRTASIYLLGGDLVESSYRIRRK